MDQVEWPIFNICVTENSCSHRIETVIEVRVYKMCFLCSPIAQSAKKTMELANSDYYYLSCQ